MEITFEVLVTVGRNMQNQDSKLFTFDYDLEKDDLEDFAKSEDYESGLDLLKDELRPTFSDDDEEMKWLEEEYEKENMLFCKNIFEKSTLRRFREFMVDKYQEQVEEWLLGALTHNSERTLNEMKKYDF